MLEGRSAEFRKNFLVTHFFNPVRYMRLLELVAGKDTAPEVMETMHLFGEEVLGKGIVYGKDTTNFIANRIGIYGMMRTIGEMQKAELTVEEVDKIFGPAMGRPKSAVFRTADIVGLDTFVHVAKNCYDTLPERRGARDLQDPRVPRADGRARACSATRPAPASTRRARARAARRRSSSLDLKTLEYRRSRRCATTRSARRRTSRTSASGSRR